ncbi:hypothetical protein KC337_g25 [Hortaea werneckii]|nr:hypothetical protein KC337_g25 [Hortaea werneckii]
MLRKLASRVVFGRRTKALVLKIFLAIALPADHSSTVKKDLDAVAGGQSCDYSVPLALDRGLGLIDVIQDICTVWTTVWDQSGMSYPRPAPKWGGAPGQLTTTTPFQVGCSETRLCRIMT